MRSLQAPASSRTTSLPCCWIRRGSRQRSDKPDPMRRGGIEPLNRSKRGRFLDHRSTCSTLSKSTVLQGHAPLRVGRPERFHHVGTHLIGTTVRVRHVCRTICVMEWFRQVSNLRHPRCKRGALPTELQNLIPPSNRPRGGNRHGRGLPTSRRSTEAIRVRSDEGTCHVEDYDRAACRRPRTRMRCSYQELRPSRAHPLSPRRVHFMDAMLEVAELNGTLRRDPGRT